MRQYIRSVAVTIAVLAFFAIGIIGTVNDVPPLTCCYRAVCGAVFVYCGITIAMRIAFRIVITAVVNHNNTNRSTN